MFEIRLDHSRSMLGNIKTHEILIAEELNLLEKIQRESN